MAIERTCTKCVQIKPLEMFNKQKSGPNGLHSWCRECEAAAKRARYWKDPQKSREHRRAKDKRLYEKNPEKIREAVRQWARRNPEKIRKRNRSYYPIYHQRHGAEVAQKRREERRLHPEKDAAATRKYRLAHPDKYAEIHARRRATQKGAPSCDHDLIAVFIERIKQAKTVKCYWCGQKIPKGERSADHIIPLAGKEQQGAHAPWNLCIACKRCNSRKNMKNPGDFGGQYELHLLPE